MRISLDLGRIWPDRVVFDHTKPSKPSKVVYIKAYIEYVVILIIYTIVVAF